MTKIIRPPAVADMFYPANPLILQQEIDAYLYAGTTDNLYIPKAVIVPHAGTIYSGPVAATAYRMLLQYRHVIRKVILLGPAHRVAFTGLAVPGADQFQTPLGIIKLDTRALHELVQTFSAVQYSDSAHAAEHSLEVQLPFLQSVLASFRMIPLLVGETGPEPVAAVLDHLWGGEECLIVVSSDLSHYHSYEEAQRRDAQTARQIESYQGDRLAHDSACGRIGIAALLQVARTRGLRVERLDLRNSGDTAGPRNQVVGYGSWGFFAN